MTVPKHFISCDWGTSSFRLRLIEMERLRVAAEITGGDGIRSIHDSVGSEGSCDAREAAFSRFLGARLDELLSSAPEGCTVKHVMLSGMATSTIGWRGLPYARVPFELDGSGVVRECIGFESPTGRAFELFLISGVATESDIMRGEETELLGILNHPKFRRYAAASVVLMPGTHSKHALAVEGRIVDWRTFMTGELFETLTSTTILRQTTTGEDDRTSKEAADESFREGALQGFENGMEATIFQARSRAVLNGCPSGANREFLSGALIGSELRHAFDAAGGSPIVIVGSGPASSRSFAAAGICAAARTEQIPGGPGPEIVRTDLAEGSAAILGHAFLLKRWLGAADTDSQ